MEVLQRNRQEQIFSALGQQLPSESTVDEMRAVWRKNAQDSLYFMATAVLGWNKIQQNPHLPLCKFIQDIKAPHKQRKVVLIPRDTYKSTIGSKSLPFWILAQDDFCGLPGREHRILLWSHSSENAKKQIKSIRQQVERNQILQWLFPELIPDVTKTTWTDSNLLFPREGTYGEDTIEAAGIDTHLVSRHYTIQIKDDLEDKASYEQPSVRQRVIESYKAAEALFVDERSAYDLLIGTRWGHDDLYSEIIKNEYAHYEFLVRPLHWTREEIEHDLQEAKDTNQSPVWNMDPEQDAPVPGKTYYFFPELFPAESCKRIKDKQGSFMYSMLYLNNPKDPSLAEFHPDDLRFFTFGDDHDLILEHADGARESVALEQLQTVLFWDPALSEREKKRNSRNAMVVMARDSKDRLYVLDAWAEFRDPTLLFSRFISFHQRYNVRTAAIEDVGFQRTLKFPLFREMKKVDHVFHVEEQRPISSKDARIRTLIPYVETHNVFIRRGLSDFLQELKAFPVFKTKDLIDAAAACLALFGLGSVASYAQRYKTAKKEQAALNTRSGVTGY